MNAMHRPYFRLLSNVLDSVAPSAGEDKPGRSDLPHFATQAAPGENADCLSFHMKNRGLRRPTIRKRRKRPGFHRVLQELSGVLNSDLRQYSCDTPYSAIGMRRQLQLRYSQHASNTILRYPNLGEASGGIAR